MFQLDNLADIRNVTQSKGKEEDSPVRVTISLQFRSVSHEAVAAALGCKEADLTAWFSEEGDSKLGGVEEILTSAKFEEQHKLIALGFELSVTKVSKVKITPHNARTFSMYCNVQFEVPEPADNVIEAFASHMHQQEKITLRTKGDLVDQSEAANDESNEPTAEAA